MSRILVCGDTHISARHLARGQAALSWLLATALQKSVDLLVVAGDLFDGARPTPQEYAVVFAWLAALERSGIKVAILEGNHDQGPRGSSALEPLAVASRATIVRDGDPQVLLMEGARLALLPFPAPSASHGAGTRAGRVALQSERLTATLAELAPQVQQKPNSIYRPVRILIAHHTWQGAEGIDAQPLLAGDVGAPLPDSSLWDLILTGHVHKRQCLRLVSLGGRSAAYYLGAVDRHSHGEADYKCGAALLDVEAGRPDGQHGWQVSWRFLERPEAQLTQYITIWPGALPEWSARAHSVTELAQSHLRVRGQVASLDALEEVERLAQALAPRLASVKLEVHTQRATAQLEAADAGLSLAELLDDYRTQRPGLIEGEDLDKVSALLRTLEVAG